MITEDLLYIFKWWVLIFVIGLINLPLTWILFKKFIGLGYAFAKSLGVLAISYLMFLLSIFHLAKFSGANLVFIVFIFIAVNTYLFLKKKEQILTDVKDAFGFMLTSEVLFTAGLIFWSYVRAHQPDIRGLEKFMDFGFINSALKSDYLPPVDMWFTGKSINYYWFGHYLTAVLTKLSGIPSEITYNLMLATIMGLTLSSAFIISGTLVKSISEKISLRTIFAAGIISALLLTFAGNFHTPFYILKDGAKNYWYPDATRFIGYNPDVNDKTIHEFPIYSFVVSDLHPHLMNFPFVLLYLALLWRLVNSVKERKIELRNLLLSGFMLGIFFMTSTWDFGNYFLATASVLGFYTLYKHKFKITSVFPVVVWLTVVAVLGFLTAVPFLLNFESIAEGVKLVNSRTPLWQLAILWGF